MPKLGQEENQPIIPLSRPQSYVIDVISERTGEPIYRVNEASIEELQDIVVYYHSKLEEIKRQFDTVNDTVNDSLGYGI